MAWGESTVRRVIELVPVVLTTARALWRRPSRLAAIESRLQVAEARIAALEEGQQAITIEPVDHES
jgi:hypothetical protein